MPGWFGPVAVLCALLLSAAPGFAQTVDTADQVDLQAPGAEVDQAQSAIEALERSRKALQDAPKTEVTFAQILQNPDDLALNFAFAQQQVRKGELKLAATTLERMLLIEPNLHEVRLFYALVLIQLDSLDAAERELKKLQRLDMPDNLRVELEQLLDRIAQARSRWDLSLLTAFGANYDWNVNSVPEDRIRLFAGVPATLSDDSARIGDFSFTGIARWDMAYDLGYQARHQAVGSILYFIDDQVIHDPLDISSLSVDGGVRLRFPDLIVTPRLGHTALWLSREQYFSSYKASLDWEWSLPPDMKLFGDIAYSREKYFEISESASGPDQNGPRVDLSFGMETDLDNQNRVTVTYGAGLKRGVPLHEHRYYHDLTFAYLHLFDHGGFLNSSLKLAQSREFRPDPGDDPNRKRRDITGRARLSYGVPIGKLVDLDGLDPRLALGLGKTVASVAGEAFRSTSTIRNYRYWNRRAEVLLTRKWTF